MLFTLLKKFINTNSKQLALLRSYPNNATGIDRNKICHGDNISSKGSCAIDFWQESANNSVIFGHNFQAINLKIRFKGSNSRLIIGDDVKWSGYILIVGNNREVVIGDRSTSGSSYILARDANVYIGSDCMLSRKIEIRSSDVHKIYDRDNGKRLNPAGDIIISNHVWIAAKAILSKGVRISSGSIIGAASFVNKTFTEDNVIIAGSPAKIVKRNIRWKR